MARLSDKQHAYLHGPKPVQRMMQIVFTKKKATVATCADCRNSECRQRANGGWEYSCALNRVSSPKECDDFRDARKPSRVYMLEPQ